MYKNGQQYSSNIMVYYIKKHCTYMIHTYTYTCCFFLSLDCYVCMFAPSSALIMNINGQHVPQRYAILQLFFIIQWSQSGNHLKQTHTYSTSSFTNHIMEWYMINNTGTYIISYTCSIAHNTPVKRIICNIHMYINLTELI